MCAPVLSRSSNISFATLSYCEPGQNSVGPLSSFTSTKGQITVTQCGDAICTSGAWGKRWPLSQCMSCVLAPGTLTIALSYNGTQSGPSNAWTAGTHGASARKLLISSGTFMSNLPSLLWTISLNSNRSIPFNSRGGVFAPSASSTAAQRSSTTAAQRARVSLSTMSRTKATPCSTTASLIDAASLSTTNSSTSRHGGAPQVLGSSGVKKFQPFRSRHFSSDSTSSDTHRGASDASQRQSNLNAPADFSYR